MIYVLITLHSCEGELNNKFKCKNLVCKQNMQIIASS